MKHAVESQFKSIFKALPAEILLLSVDDYKILAATSSYLQSRMLNETDISDIDFTGAIIDNLTLEETTFSNLKVSENFPVKFSKSGKLTEVTDSWSLEKLINLI